MNRIDERFEQLRAQKTPAFIPYITAGDPTLARTKDIVLALETAGADIVELGVPFSDPIGDGRVNQEAALRAMENDVSLGAIFNMVRSLRKRSQIPLVLFTYFNPVLVYGVECFAQDAAAVGVDGVLCVDLPPEEAGDYKKALDAAELRSIFLLAPTSSEERIEKVAGVSTGFIYYISRLGVTGEQADLAADIHATLDRIRTHTDKPICVGFGISNPEQAHEVGGYADGVIVGSAIVRMIGELGDQPETAPKVGAFVKSLVDATKDNAQLSRNK